MEQLIDFAIKYYYLVIIVGGLIYSMFFRKSPLEKDSRPPGQRGAPNRMPDFGGGGGLGLPRPARPRSGPPVRSPARRTEATGGEAASPAPPVPEARRPQDAPAPWGGAPQPPRAEWREPASRLAPAERAQPALAAEAAAAAPQPVYGGAASLAPPSALEPAGEEAPGLKLPQGELARAVVWAEILGPPRSRKPFRR